VGWTTSTTDKYYGFCLRTTGVGGQTGKPTFRLLCGSDGVLQVMDRYGGEEHMLCSYGIGDTFAITVKGNVVTFLHNEQLVYTSPNVPVFPLQIGCGFGGPGAKATNVHIICKTVQVDDHDIDLLDDDDDNDDDDDDDGEE
jgi:hypothetical protein